MEQWLPPNHENSINLIRADGGEIWTVLSPQRRARSPSRLTTFSDANGLVYLDSIPEHIMKDPSLNRRDPLADMLPSEWERPEKHDPEPVKETQQQPQNKIQAVSNAQTQRRTPLSADDVVLEMPWNSSSSRKRPSKPRQSQVKPQTKSSKNAGSTSPIQPDKSTDSTSPHDGSALRRSPRISELIAQQKLVTRTPPSSRTGVKKDSQKSKPASVPAIPRKRKAQPHETKTSETSGSDAHEKKATALPAKPSKVPRTEQASPAKVESTTRDSEVARPRQANREVQTPAEPEEEVPPTHDRSEKHHTASNQLQSPYYLEESALSYHSRVEKQESAVTRVQIPGKMEETLRPPYEINQKIMRQPVYRDQAIQAFGSQTRPDDDARAETAVAGTQSEQRPSRKPAVLVHNVVSDLPKDISKDAPHLPAHKDTVPTHIAHAWDKLAQRGSQHQAHELGQMPEADSIPRPANPGKEPYGVESGRSSSPLFMEQGSGYDDHQEAGAKSWLPKNLFRNGFEAYEGQVSLRNTAFDQHPNHAYSLPYAANITSESRGMPVQRPQSQGSASASSEQSRETSPEEVWRRETGDNSVYAIVHKIGMMLHRALKPREEAVDDIVKDYLENSVLLLEQMSTCHENEREATVDNHEAATKALYSLCDTAWHDVRDLQKQLQSFDISKILASARKPAFIQKMQTLNRLCDERVSKYIEQSSRATTEHENPVRKKGDLVELFKSQLYEQIGHSDASATKLQMIDAEADLFIERFRNDEIGLPSRQSDAQLVEDDPKTISQAMGQAADALNNSKEKQRAPAGEPLPGSSQAPIEVSSHYESDSDYVD
ncbi:hypothetical protein QBC32DRAFT_162751 [Pseudoneurospora amorphoporcata]|uniref:Uncharacterized protein n=1 Tax=Pseudoneurospora amorphoporcata TaxID=241081 RepID=A0AAN6SFT9_9PEZI|nr:hypothetical protein QBC32DRAFT_162751 [Pseudoneurospora amorphoporcata]